MQYLVALVMIAFGFYAVIHSYQLVRMVGKAEWAEKYLGDGGSYTMWKIAGVLLILGAFYIVVNPSLLKGL